MINTNGLKGKIVSAGYTQSSLAKALGVSRNTLSSKINGKSVMDSDMIIRICKELNIIDNDERIYIFLPKLSQKWEREMQHKSGPKESA